MGVHSPGPNFSVWNHPCSYQPANTRYEGPPFGPKVESSLKDDDTLPQHLKHAARSASFLFEKRIVLGGVRKLTHYNVPVRHGVSVYGLAAHG